MAEWFELAREARAVATQCVLRYKPSLARKEVDALVEEVVCRLKPRADRFEQTADLAGGLEDFRLLVEIVSEFTVVGVGEAITRRVNRVARRVARGAPDVEDIAADVVESLLARDGKELTYVMETATSMSVVDGLIGMHVRRQWARSRKRTVLTNQVDRCGRLLQQEPFKEAGRVDGRPAYAMSKNKLTLAHPTPDALRKATQKAWNVPRLPAGTGERAPNPYSTESLREILEIIAETLPGPITLRDVETVLEPILTAYLPSFVQDPERLDEEAASQLQPSDEVLGREAAQQILDKLRGETRATVALLLLEARKIEIAPLLGRTRPTIDRRLEEDARPLFEVALKGIPPQAERHALELVAAALHREALTVACSALLARSPFTKVGRVDETPLYSTNVAARQARRPTASELHDAAHAVKQHLGSPSTYSTEWFTAALQEIANSCPDGFAVEDAVDVLLRRFAGSD